MSAESFNPETGANGRREAKNLSLNMTNDVIAGIVAEITAGLNEQIARAVETAVRREFHALALACADCSGEPLQIVQTTATSDAATSS